MSKVTEDTLQWAYKPYDVVTDKDGCVGVIKEVDVNDCQTTPEHQISYAVMWLVGDNWKGAWFCHEELTLHCNLFVKIAQMSCGPSGNSHKVQSLFNNISRDSHN